MPPWPRPFVWGNVKKAPMRSWRASHGSLNAPFLRPRVFLDT